MRDRMPRRICHTHIISERWGFLITVSKSSPELSLLDPVVVVLRRESSGGPSPLMKLKEKRVRNITPTDP